MSTSLLLDMIVYFLVTYILSVSQETVASFFEPVQALHLYVWFFIFLIVVLGYAVSLLVSIEVDQGTVATSAYVQKRNNHEL